MDLVDAIYMTVRNFPKSELLGLTHQLKSSATSIPSNIAEGCGRYTLADQRHFFRQARGSVYELQTQIEIARRQGFMVTTTAEDLTRKANEVGRLINGFLRSLGPKG
jgi:four helix bundle protein